MAQNSLSPRTSSNGSQNVDLLMNPNVAKHAGIPARPSRVTAVNAVAAAAVGASPALVVPAVAPVAVDADSHPAHARCSPQLALRVASPPKSPSNRPVIGRFIVAIASRLSGQVVAKPTPAL